MKILKLLFLFTIATTNQKKLFIYYNFLLKVVHTIKLLFSISREFPELLFPEHFIFLISDDIKEHHIRCCLIGEREKQNPLGMRLVVKVKDKKSII